MLSVTTSEAEQVDSRQSAELVAHERQQVGQEEAERPALRQGGERRQEARAARYARSLPIASEMNQ